MKVARCVWRGAFGTGLLDSTSPGAYPTWYVTMAVRLIYETSQTDGDVQRRLNELIKYMAWKQGRKTLDAYEHYLDALRHAEIADTLHARMLDALQNSGKGKRKQTTEKKQPLPQVSTEEAADFEYLLQLGGNK